MLKYLSRKYLLILITVAIVTVIFVTTKKLTGDQFVWGLVSLVGLYVAGNTVSRFKT